MNKGLATSLEELIGIAERCHQVYEPTNKERMAVARARERLSLFKGEDKDRRLFNTGINHQEK